MEKNVVTLETAKRLKAAEFPAREFDLAYTWIEVKKKTTGEVEAYLFPGHYGHSGRSWTTIERFAGPTAQEIADQFRDSGELRMLYYGGRWSAVNHGTMGKSDTMAEALAELWLKLKEGDR